MTPLEAIQKAIQALQLYADRDNWNGMGSCYEACVWHEDDAYLPARKALDALNEALPELLAQATNTPRVIKIGDKELLYWPRCDLATEAFIEEVTGADVVR